MNAHLKRLGAEFTWTSRDRFADSPHDFEVTADGGSTLVEVKSTTGRFEGSFYLSLGEAICAAELTEPYCLYRVYDLDHSSRTARMRVSDDATRVVVRLMRVLRRLPAGVEAASIRLSPDLFRWGDEVSLTL